MKPEKLFELINTASFIVSGDDVNWCILIDDAEKRIRLLFQESASKRDWINNLNFPVKIYKQQQNDLLICKGWGNAWKSCNDEIMATLIQAAYDYSDYRITITGWSYGGAMAQIAAEDFYFRTRFKADVITFGSPKPFWGIKTKKYVKSCCNEIKNFSVRNDLVTYLPPFTGYCEMNKVKIGERFNCFKVLNPWKYHTSYGDEALYNEV